MRVRAAGGVLPGVAVVCGGGAGVGRRTGVGEHAHTLTLLCTHNHTVMHIHTHSLCTHTVEVSRLRRTACLTTCTRLQQSWRRRCAATATPAEPTARLPSHPCPTPRRQPAAVPSTARVSGAGGGLAGELGEGSPFDPALLLTPRPGTMLGLSRTPSVVRLVCLLALLGLLVGGWVGCGMPGRGARHLA